MKMLLLVLMLPLRL